MSRRRARRSRSCAARSPACSAPSLTIGAKALAHARAKVKELEQGARFKPDERDFLLDQWRRLIAETERANDDLDSARKEFADLLRMLQTREDFIDELMQIRRATEALSMTLGLGGL